MDLSVGQFIAALAESGGYALILGATLAVFFYLTKLKLDRDARASMARESAMQNLLTAQLEQERLNAEQCREMARETIGVLNRVAGVMGETNAILSQAITAFNRNTEAFDRNTEAFHDFTREFEEWKRLK